MASIDQYSVSTLPIEMLFEQTRLASGTGFAWEEEGKYYLITNWHNVTGRDPYSGKHLSQHAGEPDRLCVSWIKKGSLGSRTSRLVCIKDENGVPLWLIHPSLGSKVDVVALPVEVPSTAEMHPINKMPNEHLMLQIGMDVFILGYPFGVGFRGLPVWKRGSIASEPDVLDPNRPNFLIDAASRQGMSGSPVIRRSWVTHQLANGNVNMSASTATMFVGVYSGRLHTDDDRDAQLGMAWSAKFVQEIVAGKRRDD